MTLRVHGADLRIEAVSVSYPGATENALNDISLDVAAGSVTAVLGPSGCGKSTLLRVIAGLTVPAAGRVVLNGADLAGVAPHRRGIGLMFQSNALFPHLGVGGNVEFGLRMQKVPAVERRDRVAEVLELVGLPGWQDRAVTSLSGGEGQRVALARTLAPAPAVILLDEPLGALDRALRDRLVPDLAELFDSLSVTAVYVTHDQDEALAIADQLVVMDAGRIVQASTPAQVWAEPASEFVARFLGCPNIVDAGCPALPVGTDQSTGRVLIRSDSISLEPGSGSDPALPDATVRSVAFRGERCIIGIELRTDGSLLEVSVQSAAAGSFAMGDRVRVRIDPSGVRAV
jgi:thiamine transport system ATP-binding protein